MYRKLRLPSINNSMNNKGAAAGASGALETIEGHILNVLIKLILHTNLKFRFFFKKKNKTNNLHQFSCCTLLPNADWNSNSRHSCGSES